MPDTKDIVKVAVDAAKVIGGSSAPQSVNVVQQLLAEGLGHLVDEGVEVHTASQNTITVAAPSWTTARFVTASARVCLP